MMSNGASDLAEVVDEAPAKRTRGPGKPKRQRRDFKGDLAELQSRVGMALLLLNRAMDCTEAGSLVGNLLVVAREILQGK